MKGRLFWKILLGVWVMLLTISLGIALAQYLLFVQTREHSLGSVDQSNGRFLNLMAAVVRTSGRSGFDDFVRDCCQDFSLKAVSPAQVSRADYVLHHVKTTATGGANANVPWEVVVQAPDGTWQLIYHPSSYEPTFLDMLEDLVRTPALVIEMIASLAFSALLAWYLTRPIQRLRVGFERLARGELQARLHAASWRRRDEISDLARDFDRVAERLELLVASRDQLLHDVSHELRTPLSRLRLSIDLAKQAESESAGEQMTGTHTIARDPLARIDAECQRIDKLVGELLTLSRAESDVGRQDEYFDIPELMRTIVAAAELEARHAGILIQMTSVDDDHSTANWVSGDAELLRRGVENILRNALRYSSRGQSVDVVVRVSYREAAGSNGTPDGYVIEISDRGPGVADADLARIFEPFVRLPGERSEGVGLGLAIARRAVRAHGGTVGAFNRPGGGLTVAISVPAGSSR